MENKVSNEHDEYKKLQPLRTIYCDALEGTSKLREEKEKYLPKFPAETEDSYKYRNNTATFLNILEKTRDALCGLVFEKDITLGEDVPNEIAGTEETPGTAENIDNKGTHINVFAHNVFRSRFEGVVAILVDSSTAKARDLGEERALGLRPYWIEYKAADIINWDYQVNEVSKKTELTLIVLRETKMIAKDRFLREEQIRYRVCFLNGTVPSWELWIEKTEGAKTTHVLDSSGTFEKQTEIPIAIIGDLCKKPPLMDLTYKNIEHYQTYSDYKSGLHKANRPLFYSVNLDGDAAEIGSDIWFKCNEGGSIGFAEPAGKSFGHSRENLQDIKTEMGQLGLAMLAGQPVKGDVTATETMLDSIQETSALQVQATELKDGLEKSLGYDAQYRGKGEGKGGSVELGCSWTQLALTTEELTAMSGLVDAGQYSLESFLWYMEKVGKLPPDIDAKEEMERIKVELKDMSLTRPVEQAQELPNEKAGQDKTAPKEKVGA